MLTKTKGKYKMKFNNIKYTTPKELEMAVLKKIQVYLMNMQDDVYEDLFPLGGLDPRSPFGAQILAKDGIELNDFEYDFLEKTSIKVLNDLIKKLENKTGMIIKSQMAHLKKMEK